MRISRLSLHSLLICSALLTAEYSTNAKEEPLFEGLGSYSRKVTTKSGKAQRYFDQGLAFLHGFNHSAAIRSFERAANLDPECAMTHWAIALASGPHINFPLVPPPAAERACKELGLAKQYSTNASSVERALIDALATRYADPQPEDRSPLDKAYADAMREVWKKFPDDPDVGAFFAESLMDLRPWDQWTLAGEPQPGTDEVIATLDAVLKLNPNHPFANHLYIHAVEASPHPERADVPAERLAKLQPGLAHNVHMPSHIDIRRGRWHEAIDGNLRAIEADQKYREVYGTPQGLIPLYAAHNRNMLIYAAMMTGQRELAMKQVRQMLTELPPDFLKEYEFIAETATPMPMEVMIRFGMWDDILKEEDNYTDQMQFTRAFHHAARAIAYAAKRDPANARKEQAIFVEKAKLIPKEHFLSNNPCEAIAAVVSPMVEGEILVAEGRPDAGMRQLRAAIELEDALKYDEPPGWMVPIRHSLGAVLMNEGRFAEAEAVYREDLRRLPDNGWSLYGLTESLRKQKKDTAETNDTKVKFDKVWAKADLKIGSSCLCQPQVR